MWSRKRDQNQQKVYRKKNLGQTSQYYDDSNEVKYQVKHEKIQYVQQEQKAYKTKNYKDKANVYYNGRDFLNQFQNLTEQCAYLVESLSKGSQECIICQNPIYQKSAVWNCRQCFQPFHLGCIKRWIKKLNHMEEDQEEEKKILPGSSEGQAEEEKGFQEVARKLAAFFNWTCPNCNYSYTENYLPRYQCYCRKQEEPGYSPMVLPHSCGEYCERKKNEHCKHAKCEVLCHPGSCPPCNINIPIACYCGKDEQRVPCNQFSRSQFSCESTCDKLLSCYQHSCSQQCHPGSCSPCSLLQTLTCQCGKESRAVKCGTSKFLCGKICGRTLDCGAHQCQKVCHEGQCPPCQKAPSKMPYCPCGKKLIEELLGRQRKHCTDPIPVCGKSACDKFLPCGRHQCKKNCHNGDCQRCEEKIFQMCVCGKEKRLIPCYKLYYPDHLREQMLSPEELGEADSFTCKKVCNQLKSCNKHKCKEICCPIKKGMADPNGMHLCLQTCNKTLACGVHQCNSFCHLGYCKPCRHVANQPIFCPCGTAKLDPPIPCGTAQPTCHHPCVKILACGHKCTMKCHLGNCPPCLEVVTKLCNCGKEIIPNVYCNQQKHSCGQHCGLALPCGHQCEKTCHAPGACLPSEQALLKDGCGERCGKPRSSCNHKCNEKCHPSLPCPEKECQAEIRVYCKCSNRFVNVICKSKMNREPVECNNDCWKKQRDQKMAQMFASPKEAAQYAEGINFEYYPEEALEFAREHLKFVQKCEKHLSDIVLNKASRAFTGLGGGKKAFLTMLVFEHYRLDMCTYGGKFQKTVTDVFWKEGAKIPDVMISEVIALIAKGILSTNNDDNRNMIFEASLHIHNVTKGNTIDDLKKFLVGFKNEMYAEKGKTFGSFLLHFYKQMRAKDAYTFIKNTPNQFNNVDLIMHKKEVGISNEGVKEVVPKKQKKEKVVDDDGFTVVGK